MPTGSRGGGGGGRGCKWELPEHLILQNQFQKHLSSILLIGYKNIGEVAFVHALDRDRD